MYSSFCFLQLIVLFRSPCPPPTPPPANITRTAVQNVTSTSTAQRRANSSAQAPLGIINSLFAPSNHGPLLPAPFICFSLHSSLREHCGRRQPLAKRSPMLSLELHRVPPGIRRSTRYQVPVVRVCTRLFAFIVDFVLHLGPLRDFSFANYTRTTADPNVKSPTYSTAQTGQSAPHK